MRVCLDARGNHFGGVYTYTYSMMRTLPTTDPRIDYLVLFDDHQIREGRLAVPDLPHVTVPVMSPIKMVYWNNVELPRLLKRERINVYHGFKHFGLRYPKGYDCKMIWTLRTAAWWLFPELISLKERAFWTRYYEAGARRLDQVCCVAHADKRAFVKATGADPDKISVTQLAADERFQPVEGTHALARVRKAAGLLRGFGSLQVSIQ